MSKVIAFAGKGGVGKTTVATLVVRYMAATGKAPVLAVDADPNSNLGETMGLDVPSTIGDIRETYMKDPQGVPSGMDKVNYLETLVEQALIEKPTFDLLVMGRQEGQGCYCMVNNILNNFTDKLSRHYKYMVVDNEAGMEHLSRRTVVKSICSFSLQIILLEGCVLFAEYTQCWKGSSSMSRIWQLSLPEDLKNSATPFYQRSRKLVCLSVELSPTTQPFSNSTWNNVLCSIFRTSPHRFTLCTSLWTNIVQQSDSPFFYCREIEWSLYFPAFFLSSIFFSLQMTIE